MTYYKLLIINGMGTKFLNLSTQMVVEPILGTVLTVNLYFWWKTVELLCLKSPHITLFS